MRARHSLDPIDDIEEAEPVLERRGEAAPLPAPTDRKMLSATRRGGRAPKLSLDRVRGNAPSAERVRDAILEAEWVRESAPAESTES